MYIERRASIRLNTEQKREIEIALHERINYLERCQERCWELEIATQSPILKREYKKMGETYEEWINHVKSVLEHVECETGEIKP